jgi:hypothetical protein
VASEIEALNVANCDSPNDWGGATLNVLAPLNIISDGAGPSSPAGGTTGVNPPLSPSPSIEINDEGGTSAASVFDNLRLKDAPRGLGEDSPALTKDMLLVW